MGFLISGISDKHVSGETLPHSKGHFHFWENFF
jgi:hypothetical protein